MPRQRSDLTLPIWSFFEKVKTDDSSLRLGMCKYCSRTISHKTSITNLSTHLKIKHEKAYKKFVEMKNACDRFDPRKSRVSVVEKFKDDNSDDEEASSPVWSYFERDGAGQGRARCAVCCARVYSNMSSLTAHLKTKHPKLLAEMSPQGSEQQNEQEYEEDVFTDVIYLEDDVKESPVEKKEKIEIISPKSKPSTSRYTERKRKNSQSSDEIVYKKKRNETKIDRRHTTDFVTKEKDSNDMEIESFGTYVICLLKQLPRHVSMKLQRDIINLIMNANLSEESNEINNKIVVDKIYTVTKEEGTSIKNINAPVTSENHKYSIAVVTDNENQDSDAPSIKILESL